MKLIESQPLTATHSASYFLNNLAHSDEFIAFGHKHFVFLAPSNPQQTAKKPVLIQTQGKRRVLAVHLNSNGNFLAIGTDCGFQLFDVNSGKIVFLQETDDVYQSVASFHSGDREVIVAGTSDGRLTVFTYNPVKKLTKMKKMFRAHVDAVTAIKSDGNMVVTCGGEGRVKVWNGEFSLLKDLQEYNIDKDNSKTDFGTSIAIGDGFLFVSYYSGIVRMFSTTSFACRAMFHAHVSPINAMDINPSNNLLVTAGNDQHLLLWSVPTSSTECKISLLDKALIRDSWVTGVQFSSGNRCVVVNYDQRVVLNYFIKEE